MRDLLGDGRGADLHFVLTRLVGGGRVDDELDLAVLHHVDDVRARLLVELEHAVAGNALGQETLVGAAGGEDGETEFRHVAGDIDGAGLVTIGYREEHVARRGQRVERGDLRLRVGHAPIDVDAHHLTGGFHFRAEHDVDAGEAVPREHCLLH